MRQGGPMGRSRPRSGGGGRHHGGGSGGQGGGNGGGNPQMGGGNRQPRSAASMRHQTFDSNGPDVRVRGNAWQVYEKYQTLARDAGGCGDKVAAENYQQHAEHYYRIIEAIEEAMGQEQRQRGTAPQPPAFGQQQPDVPAGYYPPVAGMTQQPVAGADFVQQPPHSDASSGGEQSAPAAAMPQAEVKSRSPFFTPEEIEENTASPAQMIANR